MSDIPSITVRPSVAAGAYARIDSGAGAPGGSPGEALGGSTGLAAAAGGFGGVLQRALDGAVQAGHAADAQAMTAVSGGGNLTEVVTAVSKAELALQSTVAIRDRVVQAYQDIMRMPI